WQALLSAISGHSDRAKALAAEARQAGRALEAVNLAITALEDDAHDEVVVRLGAVIEAGVLDPIVIAVRAAPRFAKFVAGQPQWHSCFVRLLAASRDTSLAASVGLRIPREARERSVLSPRETEVHEL